MKLLTLNCHAWQEVDTLEKIAQIATLIINEDIAIIGLQEASQKIVAVPYLMTEKRNKNLLHYFEVPLKSDNYALLLQQCLQDQGIQYHLTWDMTHVSYSDYEEGVAILSKYPIIDSTSFWTGPARSYQDTRSRKVIAATINFQDQLFDVYSVHAGWWHDIRSPAQAQFDDLLNHIRPHINTRLSFLLGDFNNSATVRGEGYDYLLAQGLLDTYSLALEKDKGFSVVDGIDGWKDNTESLRIDLILVNQNIPVLSSKVVFNGQQTPVVSDHFGVMIEVNMPED